MCILVMIFVNDGGAGYYFFGHATWDGEDIIVVYREDL